MRTSSRSISVRPDAPANADARRSRRAACEVRTLINNAGFGLSGRFDELPRDRQREMIDLNVRALTDLCFASSSEDDGKRGGGRSSTSPRPRLSSRARNGGLFRDQGLRPVLHRGAPRGVEGPRDQGQLPSAPARHAPSSATSRASARSARSIACRWKRRPSSEPASTASTANRAVVVPGTVEQARRMVDALRPALGRAQDRGVAQIVGAFSRLGVPTLNSIGVSSLRIRHESGEIEWLTPTRSTGPRRRGSRSRTCPPPTAAAASPGFRST